MISRNLRSSLICLLAVSFFFPLSTLARRKIGSQINSNFGQFGTTSNWQLATSSPTINGVSVTMETICPPSLGNIVLNAAGQKICPASTYLFVYQIPAGPNNLVLTFSGLAGFAFNASSSPSFGVLLCDTTAAVNPPCTKNLNQPGQPTVDSLNIGFDSIGGNLILTVPAIPALDTLTFYISEDLSSLNGGNGLTEPLPAPSLTIGGAIVSPPSISFGSQEAGTTSSQQTVTLTNSPDFLPNLALASVTSSSGYTSAGDCDSTSSIASAASCAFSVAFNPSSPGSAISGTFTVTDNSPAANEIATLSGIGTSAGITISPSALIFGSQFVNQNSPSQAVKITNSSANSFAISISITPDALLGLPAQSDFTETDNCGTSLAAGANCQVNVVFQPAFLGSLTAEMTIDNSSGKSHKVELSGTSMDANTVDLATFGTPTSLSFSPQLSGTSSSSKTFTFSNVHGSQFNIVSINTTAEFAVTANTCPLWPANPLLAGDSCSVSVNFSPTLGGPLNGILTIANDVVDGSLIIPLTGTGMDFALSAAPTSTSVSRGSPASYNLSLTPEGGFTGVVQITCTGAPSEAVCTPNPTSQNLNSANAAPISIGITTKAPIVCGLLPPGRIYPPKTWPLPFVTLLLTFFLALLVLKTIRKTQNSHSWLAAAVIIIVLTCVSCGSSYQPPPCTPDAGTPTGHATITVTATNGNIQHSIALDLNVTP
jgi:hypothetical protein